jgi:hypothetical protein
MIGAIAPQHAVYIKRGEDYKKKGYLKKFWHPSNSPEKAFHFEIIVPVTLPFPNALKEMRFTE